MSKRSSLLLFLLAYYLLLLLPPLAAILNRRKLVFTARPLIHASFACVSTSNLASQEDNTLQNLQKFEVGGNETEWWKQLLPKENDRVACEIAATVVKGQSSTTYKGSALVFYEEEFGNESRWFLQAGGFWNEQQMKGFSWRGIKLAGESVWPPTLGWAGAKHEPTYSRLEKMLRRLEYMEKLQIENKQGITSDITFLYSKQPSSQMRGSWTGSSLPLLFYAHHRIAPQQHLPLRLGLWDESVVCETQSKYLLLYQSGAAHPFVEWKLEKTGIFLNQETTPKLTWHEDNIPAWPHYLWEIDPTLSLQQKLQRLLSNHFHYLSQKRPQYYQNLQKKHNIGQEYLRTQACSINNADAKRLLLVCVRSELGSSTFSSREHFSVQAIVQIPIHSAHEFLVCSMHKEDAAHYKKFVLLYYPTDHPLKWLFHSEGLYQNGDDNIDLKFRWDDATTGWPLSMWGWDDGSDVHYRLEKLAYNFNLHWEKGNAQL